MEGASRSYLWRPGLSRELGKEVYGGFPCKEYKVGVRKH